MDGWITIIFSAAFLTAAGIAVKKTSDFLTAKINAVKSDVKVKEKELARIGLDAAESTVKTVTEAVVGKLEQIKAKDLRQMVKNGEADAGELKALAMEAYDEVIEAVQPEVLRTLAESIQDVGQYIRNRIESQLLLLKSIVNGQG